MDNRVFNVNGKGREMLADTLRLALFQQGGCWPSDKERKAVGYRVHPQKGLILLWTIRPEKGDLKFIAPLGPEALAEMITEWLNTEEAAAIPLTSWDADCDHDGHNSKGWRVYCEDWGHVDREWGAICAVTPAFMWHGK